MDILKIATEWARDEIFSAKFFVLAALVFLLAALGFWQLGKSDMAKSYVVPSLICGVLLLVIGIGLIYNNHTRLSSFSEVYNTDKVEFLHSELKRAESTIVQTERTIYVIIPIIIVLAALLIIFVDRSIWRASSIVVIAMMVVLLVVDSNSHSRILSYHRSLSSIAGSFSQ